MPFDSNGNFSLVPGTIVSDGMTIQPSQHNPPFQDVANGLSQVVLRSGAAPMTGPLNMNGNKVSGVASGDQPGDVVTRADISNMAVDIGDGAWSVRDLGSDWLRRDGKLYLRSEYPDLAELMPPLPDGVTWENVSTGFTAPYRGVTQAPSGTVLINRASNGDAQIITSANGEAWGVAATISGFFAEGVASGGGIYVAVGANGLYSQSLDGAIWSSPTMVAPDAGLTTLTFGEGVFIAVGTVSGSGRAIFRSTNGVNWTRVGPTGVSGVFYGAGYFDGSFVVSGTSGSMYRSTDLGLTWETITTGTSETINSVAYNGTIYVAVGNSGYVASSPNLTSWTVRGSGTTNNLRKVVGNTAGFLAIGSGGVAILSTSGTSWAGAPTATSSNLFDAKIDDDNPSLYWVVGADGRVLNGARTLPTQFRVPNDDPTYGWIRAK